MKRIAALALAVASPFAQASIDVAGDYFVSRHATDVPLARYEQGDLGIVLPSYGRVHLYPAWRAIVLGREGLAAHPTTPGGLKQAIGGHAEGWASSAKDPFATWALASARIVPRAAVPGMPAYRSQWRGPYTYTYLNCPAAAFDFALSNLAAIEKRAQALPHRLKEWVLAQDAVFDFCDWDPTAKPSPGKPPRPQPVVPQPLPATEPLYWRQLRDYQIATAHFYDESFDESTRRFDQIAATPGHPMQVWGAYLALRSDMRRASMEQPPSDPARKLGALIARADRILADPQLARVHENARATIRAARFRFSPLERMDTLARWLDDPRNDPHRESALGDWRRLATGFIETQLLGAHIDEAPLRRRHAWFDWMRTLQRCALEEDAAKAAEVCRAERQHALARWQAASGGDQRAWLLAALTLADRLEPALESAALQVPSAAPEALSVRYQLARLYRLAGRFEQAREVSGAALRLPELAQSQSDSARFLLEQERFASAASRDDAIGFLQRRPAWQRDSDTGEMVPRKDPHGVLADDGMAWLNTRMAVADLLAIGGDSRLDAGVRAGIVSAAWMRAELLGQAGPAAQAARAAQAFAGLRDAATQYLAADAKERRHVLLLAALRLQLTPDLPASTDLTELRKPAAGSDEQPTASMWCRIGGDADRPANPWNGIREEMPRPRDLSPHPAVRDRELAALRKLKPATGFVGDHALARARTHPTDPELPWLLHVVVQSTRGGCVDATNQQLSRAAWKLLHTRYKTSPWTARTPYWY
jgi:hypothetical protein